MTASSDGERLVALQEAITEELAGDPKRLAALDDLVLNLSFLLGAVGGRIGAENIRTLALPLIEATGAAVAEHLEGTAPGKAH